MDETYVGGDQGYPPYSHRYSGGFVHDPYGTRERLTAHSLHGNDRNPRRKSSPGIGKAYRIRVASVSAGLCISGIVFSVIEIIGK